MLLSLTACIGLQALPNADKDPTEQAGSDPLETGSVLDSANDGNNEPIADAGDDSASQVGMVVLLDGTGSYDPDGDALWYDWQFADKPTGSSASLADKDEEKPQLSPDVAGVYRLTLVVSDGALESEPDAVEITVTEDNGMPIANAGPDQTVTEGDTVTLDGNGSSDPDGDRLSYQWSLSTVPSGSGASLSSSTSAQPNFRADKAGVFEATLTVNDGTSTSASDRVRIVASADSGSGGSGGSSGCGCSAAAPGDGVLAVLVFATWKIAGFRRRRTLD